MGIFAIDLLIYSLKSFRGSLENYIKYNSLKGRQLSEGKITLLDKQIREQVEVGTACEIQPLQSSRTTSTTSPRATPRSSWPCPRSTPARSP